MINFSIGGPPEVAGAEDIAFLFAADAGVFVSASAGNFGPGPGTVLSPANDPWVTAAAANQNSRAFEASITLGNGSVFTGWSVTPGLAEAPLVDAADHGNEICDPAVEFSPAIAAAIVVCPRGFIPRVEKSRAVFEQGGAGMVLYNQTPQDLFSDNHWLPSVHVGVAEGEAIRAYIDEAGSDAVATLGQGEAVPIQHSVMTAFSSRGPDVVPDIIKPDVTAPGEHILAGHSPIILPQFGVPGQLFQVIGGTSMASPHVAGVLALIKQVHPDWTPAMAKSAVMTTARDDVPDFGGATTADPFDMGSGHLRPGRTPTRPNSVLNPGLVYDAGFLDYLGFFCEAEPDVFLDPEGTCADLEGAGIPTTAENLNYPSIGVAEVYGTTTVRRTVTSVSDRTRTWTLALRPPEGFTLAVKPHRLRTRSPASPPPSPSPSPTGRQPLVSGDSES